MKLLRRVPNIRFGPDVVTWQALVGAFAEATEMYADPGGLMHTMSAITIESSEFGNLLNPQDQDMVNLLISLWDGKQGMFEKRTKMSGNDDVENPWINMVACTTPAWIAGNIPEYMVGGGFMSRCVFVYASQKEKFVAYPGLDVPTNIHELEDRLVQDLEHIAISIQGQYTLTASAIEWGKAWYEKHYTTKVDLDDDRFGGYIARKQTHLHKLAMVLAASQRDELEITLDDLQTANVMLTDLEADMPGVFSKIGRSEISTNADRFIRYLQKHRRVPYIEAYRFIHAYFPSDKEFVDMLSGCIRSGQVRMEAGADGNWLVAV